MDEKVQLKQEGSMYIVLSPTAREAGQGSLKTCFPYTNTNGDQQEDQQNQLEKARKFGNKRAKILGISLEEELSAPQNPLK